MFLAISQSGETADTLAALRDIKKGEYLSTLAICNAVTSSMIRESTMYQLINAGVEIGVASTKAFTAQLFVLFCLSLIIAKQKGALSKQNEKDFVDEIKSLSNNVSSALDCVPSIQELSKSLKNYKSALFIGRGVMYPIALEGALKLKEISYIHSEGYAAGELKHGPLALVDENMPVISVVQKGLLLEKIVSNLNEVSCRGGKMIAFCEKGIELDSSKISNVISVIAGNYLSPIIFSIPLQLLSYYVANLKGVDVDQPRNLAKSVTVE